MTNRRRHGGWCTLFVAAALLSAGSALPRAGIQSNDSSFSEILERHLDAMSIRLSGGERRRLVLNQPIARLLDNEGASEVAVFGLVWINAPIRRYLDALEHIETFERGRGFGRTRRIGAPPSLEDFAELTLPAEDIADLRTCRVGRCEVKLDEPAIERFQRVDWTQPAAAEAANDVMRRFLRDYVAGYMQGGNSRLAVYRDGSRAISVGDELARLIRAMPGLERTLPDVADFLLRYPGVPLANATSLFYWQETEFGLKPTIRVSHLVARERPGEAAIASKMLYATHYFWTALELRLLVADPARGPGFWFITSTRSRVDGMTGFTGFFIRGRVRSQVLSGTQAVLARTKERVEQGR